MYMKFEDYKDEIKQFCVANGLNFDKLKNMILSKNSVSMSFSYYDNIPDTEKKGLNDETPLPVVLWLKKIGDSLKFEQTEYTYLLR
ncbi:MAG: hypothetical protein LBL93_02490 [Ruminococcus sp.]|nr:hypothetical protein [Ruminococcus sp.]